MEEPGRTTSARFTLGRIVATDNRRAFSEKQLRVPRSATLQFECHEWTVKFKTELRTYLAHGQPLHILRGETVDKTCNLKTAQVPMKDYAVFLDQQYW